MLDKIEFRWPIFSRQSIIDSEELTALELAGRTANKVNEVVDLANTVDAKIAAKEDSDNITKKRLLSPTGNFTGTLLGRTLAAVFADIADSLSLVKTLIAMVNSRESIGTIYDGGTFLETDPPTITIEGGLF